MAKHAVLLLVLMTVAAEGNDRPIIGIMAQEVEPPSMENYTSYLPASYVKAVEASGARVVPIMIQQSPQYYRTMLKQINGLVLPGGNSDFHNPHGIAAAASILYKMISELNQAGGQFPVLGVCQGFELLAHLSNNRKDILSPCSSDNVNLPLTFKPGFANSSLYRQASPEVIRILSTKPVTSNHHHFCLTESSLKRFNLLGTTWRVLSVDNDTRGLEFVSSMESIDGLLAGVQFHPEKVAWEWAPSQNNPHSAEAVAASRHFYDWLVGKARANDNRFTDRSAEKESLIYNYQPMNTDRLDMYNVQTYYFY